MKHLLLVFCSIYFFTAWSQTSDSFDDGDFTNNPTWTGNQANFIVNTSNQLQLDAPGGGSSYLSTPHNLTQLTDREGRFKINYDFSPSSGNKGETYLTATNADLSTNPDGVFLQIGENGSADPIYLIERIGGTETTILTSTAGIVSSSFEISVKVIHRANDDWELYTDLTGGTAYQLDVSANYPANVLGQYVGFFNTYTSTRADKFFFDDIYAGSIQVDNTPPTLIAVNPLSATELAVSFDEGMDQMTGEILANYTVDNGIGNPTNVQQDGTDLSLFTLTFASSFTIGNQYELTVSNVEDVAGNAIATSTENFLYLESQQPVFGDIIINEFMPDETPVVGLPETEYVEVYNRSNKYFNLNGWKLSDDNSDGIIQDVWLLPGEYLLLTPSTNTDYPQATGVNGWASLNNTGDEIHLSDAAGTGVDELTYTDNWYQDDVKKDGGWSIERINPTLICSSADNWKASNDASGGTPEVQNSIYDNTPDTQVPTVINFQVNPPSQLVIQFSEGMDSLSLVNATFTSTPSLTINSRTVNEEHPTEMTIEFNESFALGQLYSFTLDNFSDCSGNSNSYSGDFALPQTPVSGDIIINEFMPNVSPAVGFPEVQFVELYNRSNKYFYLEGWKLSDNSSAGTISGGWLYPGEYLLLTSDDTTAYPQTIGVSGWANLNNTEDEIHLADTNGTVVDELTYTDDWYQDDVKKDGGWSIERINPTLICSSADNWKASTDASGGTPNAQNSIYDNTPDTQVPTVISILTELPNQLLLTFSEKMDSLSLVNATFTSTPALTINSRTVNEEHPTEMTLEFNESFSPGDAFSFTLTNFSDCAGNNTDFSGSFTIPQAPEKGDLIINEILFNPITGGSDFVEIYNNSDKYIDLIGWGLANYDDGGVSNLDTLENHIILQPEEYIVLTEDASFQISNYPFAIPENILEVPSIPSYNNDSSTVFLIFDNQIMDKVSYSEDWHFSLLQSADGVSLERFNFDSPSNETSNWHSASTTVGFATPGRVNSQKIKPGQDGGKLSLSSKTVSPDGDGFEDALLISYQMTSPELVGDLTIYDDKGRKIKTLFEKELLGATGTVKWDGTRADGTKASIGPYIIFLELFDVDSSQLETLREVVTVAGRL